MEMANDEHAVKGRSQLLALPMAAMVLLALIGVGAGLASAAPTQVPFSASVSGNATQTGELTFELEGSGRATHLGKTGYQGSVVITNVDPDTGVITNVLTEILTAANGDTITLLCNEVATPVAPGVYVGTDEWTVIGGTGRFEHAEGSGTAVTHVDLNTGAISKELTGTITRGQ